MPETATDEAVNVAERIRASVTRIEVSAGAETVRTKVSIGVATLLPDEATIESLIHRADDALYAGKREGRDRVVAFTDR